MVPESEPMHDPEPERFYGIDVTDRGETIAEAIQQRDGTLFFQIVHLDLTD